MEITVCEYIRPTVVHKHCVRVSSTDHRTVQWFYPHSAPHSSLCPALIHLPTRYYRDTVEKNAESRLADKRPGLNLNNEEKAHNTALGSSYITLQQDSAMNATCEDWGKSIWRYNKICILSVVKGCFPLTPFTVWPHRASEHVRDVILQFTRRFKFLSLFLILH